MVAPSEQDVFGIGALVNNTYRIEKVLGRGGMGEVYLARHEVTEERFAIKVMRSEVTDNEMGVELMKREQAVRAVYHPAIIRYSELGRTERGDIYLVMDYVDGIPLDARFRETPLTPGETLALARRLAEGLAACHERGVIHRDLSPDNVLLRDGRLDEAVIIDFGIAKDTKKGDSTVIGGQFAGKYTYAPPEQFRGQVDARSDLYALGMTLLAAVRGRAPKFGQNDFEVFENKARPLDLSDLPEPLRQVIEEMTDPDPALRPASAGALIELIDALTGREVQHPRRREPEPEATVIAPATRPPSRPPAGGASRGPSAQPRTPADADRGGGGGTLAAVLVLLLAVVGAGIGAWRLGLLDEAIEDISGPPLVEPYRFAAGASPDGRIALSGFAPDAAEAGRIAAHLAETYGADPSALSLEPGAGAPVEDFAGAMLALMRALEPMEGWSLALEGRELAVSGTAPDAAAGEDIRAALAALARESGLALETDIADGPLRLDPDAVASAVAGRSGCGPLTLTPPEGGAYALGERVAVAGAVPDAARLEALRETLERRIGDRPLALRVDVLNEPVCLVRSLLPAQGRAELSIWLGQGEAGTERENPRGTYSVGENPLIDVRLPERASWGHLHVAAVDVTGTVFHMLPNTYVPGTRLADLGRVEDGVRRVRVAHSMAERAEDPSVIAFQVNENFGKTLIIAFHTEEPLFDELRPISESAEAFAEALEARIAARPLDGAEFATRLIDTRID
jgi:tRNA A-37 threonylcarbamoyl transferase component Bud32